MLLFIIWLLLFLSVVNLFALNHSGGWLQTVPITAAASVVFLLFFFTLLFQGYNLHARHLNFQINRINQNLLFKLESENLQNQIIRFLV